MIRITKSPGWLVLPSVALLMGGGCGGRPPEPPAARAPLSVAKPANRTTDETTWSLSGGRDGQASAKSSAAFGAPTATTKTSIPSISIASQPPQAHLAQVRPTPLVDESEVKLPAKTTSFMADPLSLVSDQKPSNSSVLKTTADVRPPNASSDSPDANAVRIRIGETSGAEPAPTAILEIGRVTSTENSTLKVRAAGSKASGATPTTVEARLTAEVRPATPHLADPASAPPQIAESAPAPAVAQPLTPHLADPAPSLVITQSAIPHPADRTPDRPSETSVAALAPQPPVVDGPIIAPPRRSTDSLVISDEPIERPKLPPARDLAQPPVVERVEVVARPAPPAAPSTEIKTESERIDLAMPERNPELLAICRKADLLNRHAFELAQHGAVFSARLEYMNSLEIIAEALDAQRATHIHERMLIAGFKAMDEADDFASQHFLASGERNVAEVVRSHQTPVVKNEANAGWTTQGAMSRYLTYSQEQLAGALANLPPASAALFGLGKIYTVPPAAHGPPDATGGAKAVALYQAALMVDGRNYLAANELGVLLAGFGRLPEARAALLHSLATSSQPIVWQNLAAVHKAMGEVELASRARQEAELAANRMGQAAATAYDVRWVDPDTFARSKPIDADPVNSTNAPNPPAPSKSVAGTVSWGAARK